MITNFLILFKKSPLLALLDSKRLEFSAKNGWRARVAGEPMVTFPNWRNRRDSNPRDLLGLRAFQARALDRYATVPYTLIYTILTKITAFVV